MRKFAIVAAVLTFCSAVPALAQAIYVGPGGAGVDLGSDSISMKFTDGNRAVLHKESAPCQSIFGFLLWSP